MSARVSIKLSPIWVLKHRGDEVLPIEFIKNKMNELSGVVVESSSHSNITALFEVGKEEAKPLVDALISSFAEHYEIEDKSDVVEAALEDTVDEEEEELHDLIETVDKILSLPPEPSEVEEENPPARKPFSYNPQPTVKAEADEKTDEERVKACMDKIEKMIGGVEFKALAREISMIAPYIRQNGTFDTFLGQTYLFSINNGYGLTTYLNALAELIAALKICPSFTKPTVMEMRIPALRANGRNPFEDVIETLEMGSEKNVRILAIDISEWIDNTNHVDFKDFLLTVSRHVKEFILIFRIPFVEKDIVEKMRSALNDLMFVKCASFPPLSKKEIQSFAKSIIEGYGFRISNAAWEAFHERISEERSDGKFYGLNTVKKVVRELVYNKQLSNAGRGKNDLLISKKDAIGLCSDVDGIALTGYQMLDRLVCADSLKQRINEIVSQILVARADKSVEAPCIHMRFIGNPGTGKTTVARILGKILKEKGVLRVGGFFEYGGRDFCGRFVGETAPKTVSMCRDAYGSVLFIDEAYSLYRDGAGTVDYGREALDTLIAEMENHRSDLVVIMAGYPDEMATLMDGNAGLESRMPYVIDFPNFSRAQLYEIFVSMVTRQFKPSKCLFEAAKEYFDAIPESVIESKEFSNARFVRNLFERTWAKAAMRCQLSGAGEIIITKDDFDLAVSDKEFKFNEKKKAVKIGF